jgi:hypothetical protein
LLRFQPASRVLFDIHCNQPPELLTDVERAARFFYLQKNCWSGKRKRQNFHYAVTKAANWNPSGLGRRLTEVAERLDRAQIESLPYEDVLGRFSKPTADREALAAKVVQILRIATSCADLYEKMSEEKRIELLRAVLKTVVLGPEGVVGFTLNPPFDRVIGNHSDNDAARVNQTDLVSSLLSSENTNDSRDYKGSLKPDVER